MSAKTERNRNRESQEAILHRNASSTLGGVVAPDVSSSSSPESLSAIENQQAGVIEESIDGFSNLGDHGFHILANTIESYEPTISALTEIGWEKSSIKVPLQWAYTGRNAVIPCSLADTPCATLGVPGVLSLLNATFGTSHTLDTPSLSSVLKDCIDSDYDFGTAYGRLRQVWNINNGSTIQDELRTREEEDREKRQKALVGKQIVNAMLPPRRVWDLYSNRVVPWWSARKRPDPISHAWMDEKDRVNVWTRINGKEWPVPIPKDTNLNLIRIEMLNLGMEYTWLDVLCLRQEGGPREELRAEEWKLDVPTIGGVYVGVKKLVFYLSGLGRPLSLKEGDLDDDRCWFRRAWTLQEISRKRIIAGDTPHGPLHAKPIDKNGNYETQILTRFHHQLESLSRNQSSIFTLLADMQNRVSTNPVDKVAGLAFRVYSTTIPAYYHSQSLEDAWMALMNTMSQLRRGTLFFRYPEVGRGSKKWKPTWEQVMMKPLPADADCFGSVYHDDKTDTDWYKGYCIEKAFVQGLAAGLVEGVDRCGELIVEDPNGTIHAFKIIANHKHPIPEDTYTLIGSEVWYIDGTIRYPQYWAVGRRFLQKRFEKMSVFVMNDLEEVERLKDLGIAAESRNVLV